MCNNTKLMSLAKQFYKSEYNIHFSNAFLLERFPRKQMEYTCNLVTAENIDDLASG